MPQIVLHHLNASRSDTLFWLLEELGLPYDVKVHYRTKEGKAPPSLKEISPIGKAPTIQVDGRTITESGFIVHYLMEHFASNPELEARGSDDSVFWSHFAEGSIMLNLQGQVTAMKVQQGFAAYKSLYLLLFFQKGAASLAEFIQKIAKDNVKPMLQEVEAFLSRSQNFSCSDKLGEGDFMMFYPLHSMAAGSRKGQFEIGGKTQEWLDRVHNRPAYKRGVERREAEEKGQRAKL